MGSAQSSPEKQRLNAQRYTLVVRDPTAWGRLANHGISPVYLSPHFAPALVPSFIAILEPFYTGDLFRALQRCSDFMNQLSAMGPQLGNSYDTTARYYCIIRLMIQFNIGYYYYPTDLPIPNPPHLEPVPSDKAAASDEYVVHRLLSSKFDTIERSAAQLREHGWHTDQTNKIVKDNIAFFKRQMSRFAVSATAQHPLPEIHVWFWTYLCSFIAERQHFLGPFASFRDVKAVFIKQNGAPLVARLAAERRPEALLHLVSRWAAQSIDPPDSFIAAAQGLLDGATTTKNQHVLLRLAALVRAMPLLEKGKLDRGLWTEEGRACLALAEQAQLRAAAACISLVLPGTMESLASNAQRLAAVGRHLDAAQEDRRRVDLLLGQGVATLSSETGRAAMRIMKETFDRETYLWGGMAPRNGHRSLFITHIHNWCDDLLKQDSVSRDCMILLACSATAAYRLSIDSGRAPEWDIGQSLLLKAQELLSWYCNSIYENATPSRLIVQLLRDVAWLGIQDHYHLDAWKLHKGTKEFYKGYSSWVNMYALWAPTFERWGKPARVGDQLMLFRRFVELEIPRDYEREDYVGVIRKKAALVEAMMYDLGAMLDYDLWTCSTYRDLLRILADDEIWGLSGKKEFAATFVRRVEGIWLAWPRKYGVRQPLDAPSSTDFWTCAWAQLGANQSHARDTRLRNIMANKHAQAELEAQRLELLHVDFLADCVRGSELIFSNKS